MVIGQALEPSELHRACRGTALALTESEIVRRLGALPDWSIEAGALHRRLRCDSFAAAVGFVLRLALLAERRNHHPTFSVDKRVVEVRLWTRKQSGVTALDLELAEAIDELARAAG
jgi:4a-hydroxytetrahydrobiopterin dehydratase